MMSAIWPKCCEVLRGYQNGQSFFGVCHDQLSDLDGCVTFYPGDITGRDWRSGPIEVLVLDCSKTALTNEHCIRQFFPSLIPEVSYVLHQDYAVVSRLHWIHSSMYFLRDHFRFYGCVGAGGTAVFQCIKAVIPADVELAISQQRSGDIAPMACLAADHMESKSTKCANAIRESAAAFLKNPF